MFLDWTQSSSWALKFLLYHGPLALLGHRVKGCKISDAIGAYGKNGQEWEKMLNVLWIRSRKLWHCFDTVCCDWGPELWSLRIVVWSAKSGYIASQLTAREWLTDCPRKRNCYIAKPRHVIFAWGLAAIFRRSKLLNWPVIICLSSLVCDTLRQRVWTEVADLSNLNWSSKTSKPQFLYPATKYVNHRCPDACQRAQKIFKLVGRRTCLWIQL